MLPDGKSFERSDEDERLIGVFKNSFGSVDAIPASLIKDAEELRVAEDFEMSGIRVQRKWAILVEFHYARKSFRRASSMTWSADNIALTRSDCGAVWISYK